MSASTTGQQKNKRREREFAIPERKTRRKARRFSWDLLEIFLMQLYLGSRSLSSSPGGLKHLQPLSLVWNKGKADTYSFIYSCASWDGIHLEMPYSIDHPLLPKTTTSHFTLFLCVRGFLIPPTPPYLPPPFGYWSACECKCFLLEICFKMRKRFLEITWKKKNEREATLNVLLMLKQAFWYSWSTLIGHWYPLQAGLQAQWGRSELIFLHQRAWSLPSPKFLNRLVWGSEGLIQELALDLVPRSSVH